MDPTTGKDVSDPVTILPVPIPTVRDPLWDTRRVRLDCALAFAAIYAMLGLVLALIGVPPDTLMSLATFVAPAFGLIAIILPAYFGIAEWGRAKGVLGTNVATTRDERVNDGSVKSVTTTTITTPSAPIVMEEVRPPREDI